MKRTQKTHLLSGGILASALMGANVVNFIFNAFLGRVLSFETFGVITLISTLFYIVNIFYSPLSGTVNYVITSLGESHFSLKANNLFLAFVTKRILFINGILTILWIIFSPFLVRFFHMNASILYLFPLVILFYPLLFINRGYLQGKFFFVATGIVVIAEPLIKLLSAAIFVSFHQNLLVYLSLYISALAVALLSLIIIFQKEKTYISSFLRAQGNNKFPFAFYAASLATGVSTISFLALDVILVKHYLSPEFTGQYALLSLLGKIIYFLGSTLNVFTISLVTQAEGQKRNSRVSFYKLLGGSILLTGTGFLCLGIFGNVFIPLLFGKKSLAILSFSTLYCLAILLYTLMYSVVTYHLAKKQFVFSLVSLIMSFCMVLGIILYHQSLWQVVETVFGVSIANALVISLFHLKYANQPSVALETIKEEIYE